ncbi:aryl-alcohol dehydrogenase-like predicted oxidoreductase [Nocardia tenerifensis]|uniref:Aryl-alcohol dehydrogenase-like predicted oxidoreductase n=1 Tax=Nocardia tenerifensis TaxID=228006 RepID=A0A318K9U7_9NOCA|nr:aldo/keto reductase [Nocardia tenerifensis]PXX70667.1 aryl-alcohol dehydrogenase-like predicted oxidoreductase [Nocardia tenerifensis]
MTVSNTTLGADLRVPIMGFGAMALTPIYGEVDPDDALATLHHAVDRGIGFLDTANIYGGGANEELLARLLATRRREEVVVATKFGIDADPSSSRRARGDREYVRRCVEESLNRLGTDVIDLYYLHRVDLDTPIEETVAAMAELVAEGIVGAIGLSEVTAAELIRADAVHPIAAVQSEWSLWSRDVEREVVPTAARLGVGFVPYSPLGRGFLTGTLRFDDLGTNDFRRYLPRFQQTLFTANIEAVAVVRDIARELDATAAQVALAWLYHQGDQYGLPVVPIPGTRRVGRVEENLGALTLSLTEAHLARLDQVAERTHGARSADLTWVSAGRE